VTDQIFIVGSSRSGTTMLGRILGAHSRIYTFDELHVFEHLLSWKIIQDQIELEVGELIRILERLFTSAREGFFEKVVTGRYDSAARAVLKESKDHSAITVYKTFLDFETRIRGKATPCEQTPRYVFYSSGILSMFPEARIINIVRDPRDVLLSQKNKWRRRFLGARNIPLREALRSWVNYHPYTITQLWCSCIHAASSCDYHSRFHSVRYEDLVVKPEETVRSLCEFLSIEFEENMLNIPTVGSSMGEDAAHETGIASTRSGRWRRGGLSEVEINICESIAWQEMPEFGYALEGKRVSPLRKAINFAVLVLKVPLIVIMNVSRTRSITDSLQRRFLQRRKN
jgi:hypothetical protein